MSAEFVNPDLYVTDQAVQGLPELPEDLVDQKPDLYVVPNDEVSQDEMRPTLGQRFKSAYNAGKTALLGAVVAFEAIPVTNEGARAAVFAAAQAGYDKPLLTAAATAATTFAIEASGSVAAAKLLDGSTGDHITRGLDKIGLSGVRTTTGTEAAAAMTIGVPLTMALKNQQEPTRTEDQNRKYGLMASAGVSSVIGGISYMAAEGMTAFESVPEKVGVGVLALGGLAWAAKKLRNVVGKNKEVVDPAAISIAAEADLPEKVAPSYELTQEELDALEQELVDRVREKYGKTVASVWVSSHSPYANFIRTHENQTFSKLHVPELFEKYEDESAFLITVDTRKGQNRAIRGTRLSSPQFSTKETDADNDEVRIAMIQDMVGAGQFTNEDFVNYYKELGINPHKSLSIETNFRIGNRAPRIKGMIPVSHIAYLSMYNFVLERNLNARDACIFAHVNDATVNSLTRMGVPIDPLMGNENLRTPAGEGTFDDDFKPVALFNTPEAAKKMRRLRIFAPKEMRI